MKNQKGFTFTDGIMGIVILVILGAVILAMIRDLSSSGTSEPPAVQSNLPSGEPGF